MWTSQTLFVPSPQLTTPPGDIWDLINPEFKPGVWLFRLWMDPATTLQHNLAIVMVPGVLTIILKKHPQWNLPDILNIGSVERVTRVQQRERLVQS